MLFFELQDSPDTKLKPYIYSSGFHRSDPKLADVMDKFPGPRDVVTRLKSQLTECMMVFMSITEYGSFYFYSSFMINTKHIFFSYSSLKLSFFLKNESPDRYLVWRMYGLIYELCGSGCLPSMLGRD